MTGIKGMVAAAGIAVLMGVGPAVPAAAATAAEPGAVPAATPFDTARAQYLARLFGCRFEQPGRGERLLARASDDPAISACIARRNIGTHRVLASGD